jgi:hypothetical protein
MGFTTLLIIFLALMGFLLFLWSGKKPEKRSARIQTINLIANIATIIGIVVAFAALIYAYLQYRTYKIEIARRPDVYLQIAPISRPDQGVFHVKDSNDYSNDVKIGVTIHNRGSLSTSQVFTTVVFNDKVKVLSIDYSRPGFEIPVQDRQIFMFTNINFPLPPNFIALPIFRFTCQLKKDCLEDESIVGCYYVQGGGEKTKSFLIKFDPHTETFRAIPCDLRDPFESGPLQLMKK